MPTITYNATGTATETQMNDLEADAKQWRNGTDKVLLNIDKRFDVGAVQIHIEWTVPEGDVDSTVSTLDSAISNFGADLPPATESATVRYR